MPTREAVRTPIGDGIPMSDYVRMYGDDRVTRDDVSDPTEQLTKQKASTVYRDLPIVTIQNTWEVEQARAALYAHMTGVFDYSTQLWEACMGDDRVIATLGSRIGGLFGREVRFKPANDTSEARECCDAWAESWKLMSATAEMRLMSRYAIGMGFAPAQLVWDTRGDIWQPYLRFWNNRMVYFDWSIRKFMALTDGGTVPIIPGNGKWVLHAPWGEYRGWIHATLRAVAEPWMLRHFAFRDMARFSEVHGMPTRVGMVPAVGDPGDRAAFETSIASLGSDAAMILPQGVDGPDGSGYDYKLVEAVDTAWESFGAMISRCDTSIVLSILFQNLTTEVQDGSFSATNAHMDIREGGIQDDDASWTCTAFQISRAFAYLNFGDADLAPTTYRDVKPREDLDANSKRFQAFATAIGSLTTAGYKFTSPEEVKVFAREQFGLNLPSFVIGEVIQKGAVPPVEAEEPERPEKPSKAKVKKAA